MSSSTDQISALISLMDRQYQEIRAIETDWQILGQQGDYRPRIEYYHDAVRALTAGVELHSKESRLSVERLAYDAAMLRHIQGKPLTAGRADHHQSPHMDVALGGGSSSSGQPDRELRQRLAQLYKDYTVIFVAIFAEKADRNADNRTEEINALVEDCHTVQELLNKLARGEVTPEQVLHAVQHLENDKLRTALTQLLHNKKPKSQEIANGIATLKQATQAMDKEIKAIDQAAMSFSTTQLAVYEDAKDTVKRMANAGLNIAGKFVENAIAQASDRGRGR